MGLENTTDRTKQMNPVLTTYTGTVEKIFFQNTENSWAAILILTDKGPRKASGLLPGLRLGMTRLWGRKVNDLAFGLFVQKLEHVASKYGTKVVKVDRFYPSSKTCSECQYVNERLSLRDRRWVCPVCGTSHDRDLNASVNILRQGIVSSGSIRKTQLAARGALATGESPLL